MSGLSLIRTLPIVSIASQLLLAEARFSAGRGDGKLWTDPRSETPGRPAGLRKPRSAQPAWIEGHDGGFINTIALPNAGIAPVPLPNNKQHHPLRPAQRRGRRQQQQPALHQTSRRSSSVSTSPPTNGSDSSSRRPLGHSRTSSRSHAKSLSSRVVPADGPPRRGAPQVSSRCFSCPRAVSPPACLDLFSSLSACCDQQAQLPPSPSSPV